MKHGFKFSCVVVLLILMTACSSTNPKEAQRQQEQQKKILSDGDECIAAAKKATDKAQCFHRMYLATDRVVSDSDPDKLPSMNALRQFYTLYVNISIGKVDPRLETSEMLRITTELQREIDLARQQSNLARAADQQRRTQMMQEAARLLSTPQSNVRTCTPSQGAPTGTMTCY
jgi:hypothetical protein